MRVDLSEVEEACKELYIRALKLLPPDIKEGFKRLDASETDATGKAILGTMIRNITVAEANENLLCQDTGIPIYNVTIGRDVRVDGVALKGAIRRGVERATREHPLRSSVVHPITRVNEQSSCGRLIPNWTLLYAWAEGGGSRGRAACGSERSEASQAARARILA